MNSTIICFILSVIICLLLIYKAGKEYFQYSEEYIKHQGYRGVIYPNTYTEAETTFGKAYIWAQNIQDYQQKQSIDVMNIKNAQENELNTDRYIWALQQQVNAYNSMMPYFSPDIIDPVDVKETEKEDEKETEKEDEKEKKDSKEAERIIESFDIGLPIYLGGVK